VARGVYQRLSRMLPEKIWTAPPQELAATARPMVTKELVDGVAGNVTRRLSVGPLRVGMNDDSEFEPARDLPLSQRWQNTTPDVAKLADAPAGRRAAADVSYNFAHGNSFTLTTDVPLPQSIENVARLRLAVHPDDSWHTLSLVVESGGRRWTSSRDIPLANFDWQTLTWQWPGDEDSSLKVHNWITLQDSGASEVTDAKMMRVTLAVSRATPAKAWWNKTRLNYDRVADSIPFWRYLRVSLFLVAANVALTLFTSSFVAYAFSRLHWPGRDACFVLMLATMMIPGQVLMIPHFLIWKEAGAFDTLVPLWLPALFGNAFYVFMLRQFIRGIPPDLEEAARIDGCTFIGIYWHVILPLIKPSLAAIAIFTFMASWNDFFGPLLYVADQRLYPLSFGLYALAVEVGNSPTITMAAGVLMTIPVVAIFFAAQRYFVQGITLTGMKG
jgi:multiple sugar transport system permease protein